jgi:hypothetical protein
MNPKKKIERSQLHRMVWEEALSKLAPKLGLSDVGLHKICKRHNIPLPPQGYWARSPERGSPKRIPLPQPDKDWDLEFIIPPQATPGEQSELDQKFGPQIATESLPENQIAVVANQEQRHRKSAIARHSGGRRKADTLGQVRTRQRLAGGIVADVGETSEAFQHAECLQNAGIDPDTHVVVSRLDPLEGRARRECAFGHHGHGQPPAPTGVADVSTKRAQGTPNARGGSMGCGQMTPS